MDPQDPYAGGGGSGDPATGNPTPGTDEVAALKAQLAESEQRNAKLREDERLLKAEGLGAKYGLTPTQVELLSSVDRDKQEEKAVALATEMRGGVAPPAPAPTEPPVTSEPAPPGAPPPEPATPPAEPVAPSPDAALIKAMSDDRSQPVPVEEALGFQDELRERIAKASSVEEIQQIQDEFKRRQREAARSGTS